MIFQSKIISIFYVRRKIKFEDFYNDFLFQSKSYLINSSTKLTEIIHNFEVSLKNLNLLDMLTLTFLHGLILQRRENVG